MAAATFIAYCAGLFDGEGCVLIYKRSNNHGIGSYTIGSPYTIRATVSNTNKAVIDLLKRNFGGNVNRYTSKSTRRYDRSNHKPAWKWVVQCNAASTFLVAVRPFLVIKGKEADVAIKLQKRIKSTQGCRLSAAELKTRDRLWARLLAIRGRTKVTT
jgi:hypothetical protein